MLVLSYGAGINTFALLLKLPEWNIKPDLVVFADTGNEKEATLEHLKQYQVPEMERQGLSFVTVKNDNHSSLLDYSLEKRKIPWRQTRAMRYCTGMFKLDPMYKYLGKVRKKQDVEMILGIAYDEIHRMTKVTRRKWCTNLHPLIERRVNREDCRTIIKLSGYPIPPKSGCRFCPFQKKSQWAWVAKNEPKGIMEGIALEKAFNAKMIEQRGDKWKATVALRWDGVPLEKWYAAKASEEIKTLDKIEADEKLQTMLDETCDLGSCMT